MLLTISTIAIKCVFMIYSGLLADRNCGPRALDHIAVSELPFSDFAKPAPLFNGGFNS